MGPYGSPPGGPVPEFCWIPSNSSQICHSSDSEQSTPQYSQLIGTDSPKVRAVPEPLKWNWYASQGSTFFSTSRISRSLTSRSAFLDHAEAGPITQLSHGTFLISADPVLISVFRKLTAVLALISSRAALIWSRTSCFSSGCSRYVRRVIGFVGCSTHCSSAFSFRSNSSNSLFIAHASLTDNAA